MEVALQSRMIQFSIAPAYQLSPTPNQRNRRSIYAYRIRGLANPFLEIFNQPNQNDSCEARDSASVSPQAFTLMNGDAVTDRSIASALLIAKDEMSLEKQIVPAVKLTFGRSPTDKELNHLTDYINEMRLYHKRVEPTPMQYSRGHSSSSCSPTLAVSDIG